MIPSLLLVLASAQAQDSLSFVVVGDTQTDGSHTSINWDVLPELVDSMNLVSPDFAVFVGDLVGGSSSIDQVRSQWGDFDAVTSNLTCPRYLVPGNHDVYSGTNVFDAWVEMWPFLPTENSPEGEAAMTYYFDWGNTRMISVRTDDPVEGYVPVTQQEWLDDVLDDSSEFEHIFVYSHHPVSFSTESPLGGAWGDFWQSLVTHDVTGYFSGHWHRYQPSQLGAGGDTWETIIGTGGGAYYAPWRAYQQLRGFLHVEIAGALATATFYADSDEDGLYDDPMDSYVMAWDGDPPVGMVAHYDFEDGVVDLGDAELSKNVDGELLGDASLVAEGIVGDGVEFGGSGYVEAGSIGDYVLAFKGDMTLSSFARVDSVPSGSWGGALLTYGTSDYYTEDEETNYSYWLSILSDGTLLAFWEYGDGSNISMSSTVAAPMDGDWHHYAFTRDADAMELRFYLDGEQLGEPVSFEILPTGGGRGMLYMGSDVSGLSGYELTGAMDEVCLFNEVLDAERLFQIFETRSCVIESTEPVDTGDSGGGDTGQSDTDSEGRDTDEPEGGEAGGEPGSDSSDMTGCGCSVSSAPSGRAWALLSLLGLALLSRRKLRS